MAIINLGGARGGVAVVDDDMQALVSQYRWHVGSVGYVRARVDGKVELMHRLILRAKGLLKTGHVSDHISGDKLDNRLVNLRVCLQRENARNVPMKKNNTSGIVGVSWDSTRGKWLANIKVNRKFINLGWHSRKADAAAARAAAEREYFGEFAHGAIEVEPITLQADMLSRAA